ncbi:hypothetical protein [Fimbriiglobus ruber]|uniref:Phage protein n=1 Tax=Fimbriiglobus ruber TaxID=1908690 RepID=A0A225E6E1_9BACT|nr:hypothetical protein [Fimbriiglobus ruber]OWK47334.1 hypothetical protein FRUB_01033 [Fimbriiglobus ruber]
MTAADVREAVLAPLTALYPPPTHLRADERVQAVALAAYEKALAGFDRATLERGWAKVVAEQTYWVWPNPGVIAEACRQCAPPKREPSEAALRRQQAQEMTDAYVTRYMKTSQVWKLAQREGWAAPLLEYVQAAAWVQAQLICKTDGIGWDTLLIDDPDRYDSSQEAFSAYCDSVRGPVERGRIRVTIPPARVLEWKDRSSTGRGIPINSPD